MTHSAPSPDDHLETGPQADGEFGPNQEFMPAFPNEEPAASPVFHESDPNSSSSPIGPGLWEAFLWIGGFFLIEIVGGILWSGVVIAGHMITTGGPVRPDAAGALLTPYMPWMIGSIKAVEVVIALLAIRLRYGSQAFRLTGFRAIPWTHLGILVFAVVPTAFLSGQCYSLLQQLTEYAPFLKSFDELSSIEAVQEMAKTTPLAVLVLIIAVFPAMNEEFVFRAAIGRGLLGRYGLVVGIAVTSVLFGAVHLSPIHAVALLPLAVLMHVGYVSSGSIWWAVAAHFLNNAMSVVLMKLATIAPEIGGMTADVTESKFSPIVFFAAIACLVSTVWLLLRMQVGWRLEDGSRWRPERPGGVEPPLPGQDATLVVPSPPAVPLVVASVCYVLFPVALVVAAALQQL